MQHHVERRDYFLKEGFFPDNFSDNDIPLLSTNSQDSTFDVLCGRDVLSNKHPGNRLFRRLIKANKEFYKESVNSSYKRFLVTSIIAAILNKGGWFVRKEGGTWSNLPHKDTRLKTAQALRAPDW